MALIIRRSVTSLGRTWPSTIFWRAVEKADMDDLEKPAPALPRVEPGTRVIFGTSSAETQHADWAERPLSVRACSEQTSDHLFDSHRQSTDQPRHLIQMVEKMLDILGFDGLGQSNEAFVVAHCGHIIRRDLRHGVAGIGLGDRHRSPLTNPARSALPWNELPARGGPAHGSAR